MLGYQFQPDTRLRVSEVAEPIPASGDAVVEVEWCGICGTDLKIARGEHRFYPVGTTRVPGHELSGRIVSGARLDPGTPVVVAPNFACGRCPACRRGRSNICSSYDGIGLTVDGGFAERVLVPAKAVAHGVLLPVPPGLGLDVAVLAEPVAAVVRGMDAVRAARGQSLLVIGAGPMGLISVIVGRQLGMAPILVSQRSAARRQLASDFGAQTIDPVADDLVTAVSRLTGGDGVDVVMITTPVAEVFTQSLRCAAPGGRINFFAGLPTGRGEVWLDANLVHYNELTITGNTANTPADNAAALAMIASHPAAFAPLVTHRFPIAEADEAFAVAKAGSALKVLLGGR